MLLLHVPEYQLVWRNMEGRLPLHLLCETGSCEAVRELLNRGGPNQLYCQDQRRKIPLNIAMDRNAMDLFLLLLTFGDQTHQLEILTSLSPTLQTACARGNFRVVQLLLQFKPELAIRGTLGNQLPIQIACETGNLQIVRELLSVGLLDEQILCGSADHLTRPIDLAYRRDSPEIVALLLQHEPLLQLADPSLDWREIAKEKRWFAMFVELFVTRVLNEEDHLALVEEEGSTALTSAVRRYFGSKSARTVDPYWTE